MIGTIYAPTSPYHRPAGGTRETVERLEAETLRRAWLRGLDPARATLIVGGDLAGQDVPAIVERLFGSWASGPGTVEPASPDRGHRPRRSGRLVRVIHRPGSVQTEIRIGHRGLPRRIPDFHAVSVMSAILGGLFNSRLNMKLREEKGYTYGAGAGFDMRRGAGPFAARAAVNTEVTVPAIVDTLAELTRMRDDDGHATPSWPPRGTSSSACSRCGSRPPAAVVGALGGLVVHGLPVEELVGYRSTDRGGRHRRRSRPPRASTSTSRGAAIVLVGDVDAFGPALEAAGLGRIVIEPDDVEGAAAGAFGPRRAGRARGRSGRGPRPVDEEPRPGPTAGAEEPSLPGIGR